LKKIIFSIIFLASNIVADIVSVVPYVGYVSYDKDRNKSLKNSSTLGGIYTNIGNLSYIAEFNYAYINTEYKTEVTDINLNQHDFTFNYASYKTNYMYKVGIHYTYTNDIILNDGVVAIISLGGYQYSGYDKYRYGVDGFYSFYLKGRSENDAYDVRSTPISVIQLSPYFSFFKSISINASNLISFCVNYQYAFNYIQQDYLSYELSDTFYYKSFFVNLSGYNGEMRSGVKQGGLAVYNSLDLMKYGVKVKLGYYLTPALVANLSYSANSYQEYSLSEDTFNSITVASLNYRF